MAPHALGSVLRDMACLSLHNSPPREVPLFSPPSQRIEIKLKVVFIMCPDYQLEKGRNKVRTTTGWLYDDKLPPRICF